PVQAVVARVDRMGRVLLVERVAVLRLVLAGVGAGGRALPVAGLVLAVRQVPGAGTALDDGLQHLDRLVVLLLRKEALRPVQEARDRQALEELEVGPRVTLVTRGTAQAAEDLDAALRAENRPPRQH